VSDATTETAGAPISIAYEQTWDDVLELNRTMPKVRLLGWLTGLVGVAIIVAGFIVLSRGTPSPTPLFVCGPAFVLLGLLAPRLAAWGIWKRRGAHRLIAEIDDAGMVWRVDETEGGRVRMTWDAFDRAYETPRLIVIHRGLTNVGVMIPKRALADESQAAALRAILRRNIKRTPWSAAG
jgi:hypothetical protein